MTDPDPEATLPTPVVSAVAPAAPESRCPGCASAVHAGDRFCENCGHELGGKQVVLPNNEPGPPGDCENCGGTRYDPDGYCTGCGQLRGAPDRFAADLGAVAVVTDRGIAHARNEDAVAAAVLDDSAAVVIAVADGVSTSEDPQVASGTAARTGVDACRTALLAGRSAREAVMAGLEAAATAVRGIAITDGHAPSCTYVSAVVQADADGVLLTVANVGDSRAYWLHADAPEDPANPASQRLTVDDSWAQALVDAGAMDEQAAMNDPRAHTLIRWLGADGPVKPWSDNCVRTLRTTGPGVLLLCSDGLWNYLSDATALAELATAHPPAVAARELVEFALRCGGSDNITVALVPIPWSGESGAEVQ
ncbi:putative serine/threonine protein phosphatase [Nocardia brasiliensis NBRC 14402]|uniref:protein phosphatase 2C domain-containing protein n=1 Tax=Nocardia brasiliensis TaxID=37326 RepID=UPI0002E9ACED|nr:protein phosphatase 2C domain-containing protein [Nocardia brasiliensis]ASF06872.1 phosphatase [Nocardia brasiliensis]GAJ82232.1 putative serine/threonine protein phosphatase [Nocardia brasiliensis NBRC 14402]SUB47914.1 Serine/threonine phosphatase stp [Nocardia brasiliensis]